jgi:hypothetical protein
MPPTAEHEALHRVFQRDEALFARAMARVFDIRVTPPGPGGVTVLGTDLTETEPLERRPDSVLQVEFMVEDTAGKYILVVESQTEPDAARRRRWPHFIAHLHDKYECPVVLAVVCSKENTAKWARAAIEIGVPGLVCQTTRLVVFGPDNVPAITDPDEAAGDLMLAVFSALTHSRRKVVGGILEALATALATIDDEIAGNLAEFTETGLGRTAGAEIWRSMMATRTFPFVSQVRLQAHEEGLREGLQEGREEGREEGFQEGRQEGREEGRMEALATAVLKVLDGRGVTVDQGSRARIGSCRDVDTLDAWLDRAVIVAKASDLFT